MAPALTDSAQIAEVSRDLEQLSARDRVVWAADHIPGKVFLSSSFGAQSAVMLHLVHEVNSSIPVVLIDTGYLFPETYRFIDHLVERLGLDLRVYRNPISPAWQEARVGKLWEQGLEGIEKYNQANKIEPMERAIAELGAKVWIAGLRRQQSTSRSQLPVLLRQGDCLKVHPLIDWTDRDVFAYLKANALPYHPLWEQGYVSIGDWHTSHKLSEGMSEEQSRFLGLKRECGLHEGADFSI